VAEVLFFVAAIGAIAGAIGVVAMRNPFYSVLSLVVHLISLAALFLLLRAEFVAAAQVVVYAGAVMVLYRSSCPTSAARTSRCTVRAPACASSGPCSAACCSSSCRSRRSGRR
jgi:NADH:ubiquinone oxidoreductase subunit 6 (subunit J)